MDELNDIVFSKTFQPPSAWADRERKYKMEKRDWETDVRLPYPARTLQLEASGTWFTAKAVENLHSIVKLLSVRKA